MSKEFLVETQSSEYEQNLGLMLNDLLNNNPIPENERLGNLSLFLNRQLLSRIIFLDKMYKQILNVQGVIMEFGVRWGSNLALLSML
jgi:hypothetical protein